MKILFMTAHRLGDAVLSLASLNFLAQKYSHGSFVIICGPDVVDIFQNFPLLERLIPLKKQSYNRHWLNLWSQLKGEKWDLIVDFRSSLILWGLCSRKKIVVKGGRRQGHKLEQHWQVLARSFGKNRKEISLKRPSSFLPHLWISEEDRREAARKLPPESRYIILAPTAGSEDKIYPMAFFLKLAESFIERGYKIIFLYGAGEREKNLMAEFHSASEEKRFLEGTILDFGGGHFKLSLIAAFLERASLVIGNDSGLIHMSAAIESLPLIALFGPSLAREYGPLSKRAEIIYAPTLEGWEEDGKGVMALLRPEKILQKALIMLE